MEGGGGGVLVSKESVTSPEGPGGVALPGQAAQHAGRPHKA